MVSATCELMSSSLSKGFKSKKPQKPVICRVFFNCLRMRRWSGRRLDSWNSMRKLLWFSTFKAALSTPTRFQTLWSLRTKLKSKSSSFGWVLCVFVRGQWPRKHFKSQHVSAKLCPSFVFPASGFEKSRISQPRFSKSIHLLQKTNSTVSAPKVTITAGFDGTGVNSKNSKKSEGLRMQVRADFGPQVFRPT